MTDWCIFWHSSRLLREVRTIRRLSWSPPKTSWSKSVSKSDTLEQFCSTQTWQQIEKANMQENQSINQDLTTFYYVRVLTVKRNETCRKEVEVYPYAKVFFNCIKSWVSEKINWIFQKWIGASKIWSGHFWKPQLHAELCFAIISKVWDTF